MKPPRADIHPTAWIAPTAAVMGDVTLGAESSVWYGAVVRGDILWVPRHDLRFRCGQLLAQFVIRGLLIEDRSAQVTRSG